FVCGVGRHIGKPGAILSLDDSSSDQRGDIGQHAPGFAEPKPLGNSARFPTDYRLWFILCAVPSFDPLDFHADRLTQICEIGKPQTLERSIRASMNHNCNVNRKADDVFRKRVDGKNLQSAQYGMFSRWLHTLKSFTSTYNSQQHYPQRFHGAAPYH